MGKKGTEIESGRGSEEGTLGREWVGLNILGNEVTVDELSVGSNGPAEAPEEQARGERNVDDDLLHGGFFLIPDGNKVAPTHPPDPTRDVQEQDPRSDEFAPVPLVPAHDQVRQPVGAAQKPLLPVVVKPPLRLLHRRLYGQGGGAVRRVQLQRRLQLLNGLLLALRELLRLLAGSQAGDVGDGG